MYQYEYPNKCRVISDYIHLTNKPRSLIIDDKLFNNLITCSFIIIFTVILEQNLLKIYLLFYKQNLVELDL